MIEISMQDSAHYDFDINTEIGVLNVLLRFNVVLNRYTIAISINDEPVVQGRTLLLDRPLLPERLDIGQLFIVNHTDKTVVQPDRENVLIQQMANDRKFYLYYVDQEELKNHVAV